MDSNGIGRLNTAPTRPVRPPPLSPEKRSALRKQQSISAQVGTTPRNVRKAGSDETSKLTTKMESTASNTKNESSNKTLRQRTLEKAVSFKIRLKNKGYRAKEALKEWAKAPASTSIAVAISAKQAAAEKVKSGASTARQKASRKKTQVGELLSQAKSGASTWNQAKLDTTVSVAIALYKGSKNKARKKGKTIANYTVKIYTKVKSKCLHRTKRAEMLETPQKSIKERKCNGLG